MLRLSNRSLLLEIGPTHLKATLRGRWPRRAVRAAVERAWFESAASLPPASRPIASGEALAFGPALDRAFAELGNVGALGGLAIDVVLSDALVHFDIAQGRFGALGEQQLKSIAQACTQELLGEQAAQFEVRFQLQRNEQHLLVCAVPIALLSALRACAAGAGLRLRSVQPQFSKLWNRYGRKVQAGLGVLAVGDENHAMIALVRHGVVEALSSGSGLDQPEHAHGQPARRGRPRPAADPGTATPSGLDAKVDRLLASLGVESCELDRLVAIVGGALAQALSSRWTVMHDAGVAA